MAHYFQLLGSDTPNGYGGCCYYGPLDHPALQEPPTGVGASNMQTTPRGDSNAALCIGVVTKQEKPHTSSPHTPSVVPPSPAKTAALDAVGDDDFAQPGPTWSSYLLSPQPTWPACGPLHLSSLLHPTPSAGATLAQQLLPPQVTADTGSSGSEGYIFFNCPEGTQRFSSEANIKLKKVRCFCFTRLSNSSSTSSSVVGAASAVMGLPGMLFTVNDAGSRQATFFGPSAGLDLVRRASAVTVVPGAPAAEVNAVAAPPAGAGLRGFLTALRFHYFQYRPMVFRQLHGVAALPSARWWPALEASAASCHVESATAEAATLGNEVHFLEIAESGSGRSSAESAATTLSVDPFFYATIPLSSHSLLVAFRVSGGAVLHAGERNAAAQNATSCCRSAGGAWESRSECDSRDDVRHAAGVKSGSDGSASSTTLFSLCNAAAASAQLDREGESAGAAEDEGSSGITHHHHLNHDDDRLYGLPDSSDVVLGYAIVVAPGATFDAAKARVLGVRSGPKYGQLKLGIAVEADVEVATDGLADASCSGDTGKGKPKSRRAATDAAGDVTTTTTDPAQTGTSSLSGTRWIHPHQVMRPTAATRHAYVSLVLDGDTPQEVKAALEHLLGRCTDRDGGALLRLLRTKYPHLVYYYDGDDDEEEGGSAPGAKVEQRAGRLVQRARQLTVRHVAHVQPQSFFEDFCRSQAAAAVEHPASDDATHTLPLQQQPQRQSGRQSAGSADGTDIYARYNAFVFANVVSSSMQRRHRRYTKDGEAGMVQVGLTPSLSFTLDDLHEEEEEADSEDDGASTAVTLMAQTASSEHANCNFQHQHQHHRTWHLFTSYTQRHFTAFPTALVHRYHLNRLAPSLFPLHGTNEHPASAVANPCLRSCCSSSPLCISAADPITEYWPYSLKLRCIPEAALQLRHAKSSPRRGTSAQTMTTTAGGRTAGAFPFDVHPPRTSQKSGAHAETNASGPPLKREKKGTPEKSAAVLRSGVEATSVAPFSAPAPTTAAIKASASSARANAARPLVVVDGQASLLPYPTPASALRLLSDEFLASLQPTPSATRRKEWMHGDAVAEASSPSLLCCCGGSGSDGDDGGDRAADNDDGGVFRRRDGVLGFLGTGSAVPSKYRNVSGTYLELWLPRCYFGDTPEVAAATQLLTAGGVDDGERSTSVLPPSLSSPSTDLRRGVVIFDFGEGSLGQLVSLCEGARGGVSGHPSRHHRDASGVLAEEGEAMKAREAATITAAAAGTTTTASRHASAEADGVDDDDGRLRRFVLDVVLVFISHAHADHHLGLLSLLTLRHHYLSEQQRQYPLPVGSSRLLIVCPAEVHRFLMDAWGNTLPYRSWLYEECMFELLPPPLHAMPDAEAAMDAVVRKQDGSVDADAVGGSCAHRCGHDYHRGGVQQQQQQQQQHVVPVPRLQALLRRWNTCISLQVQAHKRHRQRTLKVDVASQSAGLAEVAGCSSDTTTMTTTEAPKAVGWWDAEVITVDHPANAHALLLRFPFCSPQASPTTHTSSGETTPAVLPDTSRVFVFSGDTRPSPFLVRRSRAFVARQEDCRRSNDSGSGDGGCTTAMDTEQPRVFILLHEATFGPGFEGEAVRKRHSTLPEALQVGAAVEAEFIVLNHFSQRYPKLPGLSEAQLGGKSTGLVCQRRPRPTTVPSIASDLPAAAPAEGKDTEGQPQDSVRVTEGTVEGASLGACTRATDDDTAEEEEGASSPSLYTNMSFAFDLMTVSFCDMHRGVVPRLTPALVRLLEEYDSWGASTTHRMRTARAVDGPGARKANSGGSAGGAGAPKGQRAGK